MFVDAREMHANQVVTADVCVVGAGPAGVMLARTLSGGSLQVCVLESGGLSPAIDPDTRSLSEVATDTDLFVQVRPEQRARVFGGNAGSWGIHLEHSRRGVRLVPFQASDFEHRSAVPYSGWPIGREQLDPYYAQAQAMLGAGPYAYDVSRWETPETPALPFRGGGLQTTMFMFGNGDVVIDDYRRDLASDPTVTVYTGANAVELETDELGETVRTVHAATVQGNRFTVQAKMVVLAAGGLESTHLLMVSDKVHKGGLGNAHDQLGRYFMDHPIADGGTIVPSSRALFNRTALYDKRRVGDAHVMGGITLSDRIVRERQLLNLTSWIFPRPLWYGRQGTMDAMRRLARGRSLKGGARAAWADLKQALSGSDLIAESLATHLKGLQSPYWPSLAVGDWSATQKDKEQAYGVFEVLHLLEQAPDPENRVLLSKQRDVLGRRRVQLHTRWREIDQAGVDAGQAILDQELRAAGLGHFVPSRMADGSLIFSSAGASHHMGTTRMSASPKTGVVDEHCKVHGVNNLFVASSSVFPTGSSLNPTLTIVAIAARVSERVKRLLERPIEVAA